MTLSLPSLTKCRQECLLRDAGSAELGENLTMVVGWLNVGYVWGEVSGLCVGGAAGGGLVDKQGGRGDRHYSVNLIVIFKPRKINHSQAWPVIHRCYLQNADVRF